jgi:expansin (peptidoglycan-binding protein)
MLGLKLVTDPRWVNIVESNEEILTDHAWCEQSRLECNKFDNTKFGKRRISYRINDYCKGRTRTPNGTI